MTTGHEAGVSAGQDASLQAAVSRARAALRPRVDPELREAVRLSRLALDPSLAVKVEREAAYRENYGRRKRSDGRASGFKRGAPQCPSCRRILTGHGAWCPACRTFSGHYDHGR